MNSNWRRRRVLILGLCLAQAYFGSGISALAALSAVTLAGQTAFSLQGSDASSLRARAKTIQKNIDNALVASADKTPSAVSVVYVKGQPILTLGGFYVASIDSASAKACHLTPATLAQRWSTGLKTALKNRSVVNAYIDKLSGSSTVSTGTADTGSGSFPYYKQGRVVYIPAGMTIPVDLSSSISSENARVGDPVEAKIAQNVDLGETSIPQGSVVLGRVTESTAAANRDRSGLLGIKFDTLRTPDGNETPITAHIVGGIGKYEEIGNQSNLLKGETTNSKVKQALVRGAIGAGGGALVGTAIGAIAGHGRGAGRGALAGTAIGGALGVVDSLLLRKGSDVKVESGQNFNLQLDAPASLNIASN